MTFFLKSLELAKNKGQLVSQHGQLLHTAAEVVYKTEKVLDVQWMAQTVVSVCQSRVV